jgi:hypothetical protein
MKELLERARAYLACLEAERKAALALSEQKAEEAKLIEARQEGFQAALELLGGHTFAGTTASAKPREPSADPRSRNERSDQVTEPRQRSGRRPIRELIARELSFSGQPMSATQIAKAIEYLPNRTQAALERMEHAGQVVRNEGGRWAIGLSTAPQANGHATGAGNGELHAPLKE